MWNQSSETIDELAAGWMARLRSGTINEDDKRELSDWLQADPRHGERLAHYEGLWLSIEGIRNHPRILTLREASAPAWRFRRFALAASLVGVLVVMGGAGSWMAGRWPAKEAPAPAVVSRLATGVGQITKVALQDGSTLVLDTDSAVETQFTPAQRRIRITRGRAFFRVAHDRARPFVVATDKVAVTATGTQFSVALDDDRDTVRMVEGSVVATSLEGDSTVRLPLTAGRRLDVVPGGRWTVMSFDSRNDIDWINGTLSFRNARLADIVTEMNRYSNRKIAFADASAADSRLNAVLKAGDVDTFLATVRALRLARVKMRTDELVVLDRP